MAATVGAVAQTEVPSCAAAAAANAAAAVSHGWALGVATQAVGAGRQAAAGLRYAGRGVADCAAHPLHGKHGVGLGGNGIGWEVNVNGCRGDDLGSKPRSSCILNDNKCIHRK